MSNAPYPFQPPPYPQPQVVVVNQQQPQSQALPALVSFFLPGLGQLIQGRLLAAMLWILIAVANFALMFVLVGFVLAPILGILCVLDAAWWQPGQKNTLAGSIAIILAGGMVLGVGGLVMLGIIGAATAPARGSNPPAPSNTNSSDTVQSGSSQAPPPTDRMSPWREPERRVAKPVEEKEPTESAKRPLATEESKPAPKVKSGVDSEPKQEPVEVGFRTWTDRAGRTIEAEFGGITFGKATLRKKDGTSFSIPLEKLSEGDQHWISRRTKDGTSTAPTPPLAIAPFDFEKAIEYQTRWAKHLSIPAEMTNTIGMKFVLIPPGQFVMGAPDLDSDALQDEKPQHPVRITKPFYLGAYEVTVGQFRRFVKDADYAGADDRWNGNAARQTENHPVVSVSWDDAVAFCNWLSEKEGKAYRLPTEAEWEYGCRAGSMARYCSGDDEASLGQYAWYQPNSGGKTHPVGQKRPNAWSLYDMHGNVWEWCADWYDEGYYAKSPADDPFCTSSTGLRVLRGGSYFNIPRDPRSANRSKGNPASRDDRLGFRVARTP